VVTCGTSASCLQLDFLLAGSGPAQPGPLVLTQLYTWYRSFTTPAMAGSRENMNQDIADLNTRIEELSGIQAALFAGIKALLVTGVEQQKTAAMLHVALEQGRAELLASDVSEDRIQSFDVVADFLEAQASGIPQA
jgi:hypothetical protein